VVQVLAKLVVDSFVITLVAVDVCGTFGGDGSKLNSDAMARLVRVGKSMRVSVNTTHLFATTSKVTALYTQPKVLGQIASIAVAKVGLLNLL
jgi:hypothetical protein